MVVGRIVFAGLLLALAVHAPGCAGSSASRGTSSRVFGPGAVSTETANAMVLAFADEHVQRITEAVGHMADETPDLTVKDRARLNNIILRNLQATFGIASSPNPIIAMTDMVVMVSLSREATRRTVIDRTLTREERELPESYDVTDEEVLALIGGETRFMYRAYSSSERDIRALAGEVFWPEQMEQFDALLAEWWTNNPSRRLVTQVRLQDFAGYRAATVETVSSGPRNLLGFLYLDPLASMDPTNREIAQSRMLAERITYQVNRLPSVVALYARGLVYETLATDEVASVRTTLEGTEQSLAQFAETAEHWPADVAAEREAALVQISELAEDERQALLADVEAAVARQRDELLRAIDERAGPLQETLSKLDATLGTATTLSSTVGETARTIDEMNVENFQQLVDSINEPLGGAERSLATIERVLASGKLADTATGVDQGLDGASTSISEIVDHAFWRGVQLIAILLVGGVVAALCFKLVAARLS